MYTKRFFIGAFIAALLSFAGCATPSPLAESRKQAVEADIDEILTYTVDPTEVGEPKRCLSKTAYRDYRALGDRHLLFEGRRNKQWINVLRSRCSNLNRGGIFVMKPTSGGQMCNADLFRVVDRVGTISWRDLEMGPTCILGEFKPVTRAQVEEIEKRLDTL
jgi:hypothetical protein